MAVAGEHARRAGVGDCALAPIEDVRIFDSYFNSIGDPVDDGTLFQMALVSRWARLAVMGFDERVRYCATARRCR